MGCRLRPPDGDVQMGGVADTPPRASHALPTPSDRRGAAGRAPALPRGEGSGSTDGRLENEACDHSWGRGGAGPAAL